MSIAKGFKVDFWRENSNMFYLKINIHSSLRSHFEAFSTMYCASKNLFGFFLHLKSFVFFLSKFFVPLSDFHPLWSVAHCSWKKCFNEIFRGGWGTKLTLLTIFYRSKLCLSQHEACNTIEKFFPNFFSKLAATKAQVWISIPELEVFWGNTKKKSVRALLLNYKA